MSEGWKKGRKEIVRELKRRKEVSVGRKEGSKEGGEKGWKEEEMNEKT